MQFRLNPNVIINSNTFKQNRFYPDWIFSGYGFQWIAYNTRHRTVITPVPPFTNMV